MSKEVSFSTTLSKRTKTLLEKFCKKRGLRMNHVTEKAILSYIEDELDLETISEREFEELVEWKKNG